MARITLLFGLCAGLAGCSSQQFQGAMRGMANTELTPLQGPQQRPQINCTSQSYDGRTVYTNCQ